MTLLSDVSCPWPLDFEACGLADLDVDTESPIFLGAVEAASSIMTRLSGYTVGLCDMEVRPINLCGECRSWCCGGADSLLIRAPYRLNVWDVQAVRLGPVEYPEDSWYFERVDQTLWRVPPDVWPKRDEKWSAPGTGEAFVVDVTVGTPPDGWAMDCCSRLTKELVLSCLPGGKCRLPSNAVSVTSQGITVRLRDNDIATFIPEVSAWVQGINPHKANLPGAVFSPEVAGGLSGSSGCRRLSQGA